MNDKLWWIIGGIIVFEAWRQRNAQAATTKSSAGQAAGSTAATTSNAPLGAGNSLQTIKNISTSRGVRGVVSGRPVAIVNQQYQGT